MALVSRPFRMDCFALYIKSAIPFETSGGTLNRDQKASFPDEPNNEVYFLGSDQKSHRTLSLIHI